MPETYPRRILVAGCGTGIEALALRKRFPDAQIVGVDFSSRSVAEANALQKRVLRRRPIRFLVGDLTDRHFMNSLGVEFDFISCHGVLSYIPRPAVALRNLRLSLAEDGGVYLGVNGAAHFSVKGRPLLRRLGFDLRKLPPEDDLRRVLRFCDAVGPAGDDRKEKLPLNYLAGDLFGPLIHNLSLRRWLELCQDAGLSFTGHYYAFKKIRGAINKNLLDIMRPRSRGEVQTLIDRLDPCGFHQMTLTRRPPVAPTWTEKRMLNLRPVRTSLYRIARTRRRNFLQLESEPINTIVEIDSAKWENQFLRLSTGERRLADILPQLPERFGWERLLKRLYLFYQLAAINFK
jgi:SAM-dependent methyltransferase